MFEALWDELSRLGSWRWPVAQGEVTYAELEEFSGGDGGAELRLSVTYKFSIGADGPYTGEAFWQPRWSWNGLEKLQDALKEMHIGRPVGVRYKPNDPSVNQLHGGIDRLLGN